MFDWLTSIVGEDTSPIVIYILIFILLIVGFFILRAALNRLRGGTFVHGGHGRKKRLAVIDAAPVDNRRRLVLVRRDDVEHLVLIGGMNDLVVERDIEVQSSLKVDAPKPSIDQKPEKSKIAEDNEPVASPPPSKPQATPAVATPKPQPQTAPRVETPKVEPKIQPEEPVAAPAMASTPTAKPVEATVALGAAAAASTDITDTRAARDFESAIQEAAEGAMSEPAPSPVSPAFRDYAVQEEDKVEVSSALSDENEVEPVNEPANEFAPISAPEPKIVENPAPAPKVEPEDQQDDSDLEDEMERLLNKLTGPTPSQ